MSRIQELIKEKCTNGVEYKYLSHFMIRRKEKCNEVNSKFTVYSVTNTKGLVKSDDFHDNSIYSSNVSNYLKVYPNDFVYNPARLNVKSLARMKNNEIGIVSPMYVVFYIDNKIILNEYFEYLIFNYKVYDKILSFVEQGARFRFDYNNWNKIKVPVPPLEVQEEILRILDKFGELEAELKAELEARKNQYKFWRGKLFKSNNIKNIENVCLNISSGGTPNTSHKEYYNGNIPWLRTQEVNWNVIYDTELKITEEAIKNSSAKVIPKNCVIVAMYGATVGKVAINSISLSTNQACCNLEINPRIANYKYVFYWLSSQYKHIKSLGQGSQTNINAKTVKTLKIPVPSLEEQQKIVSILDKFDKLVNDILEGLPAEIELRKKQYEYYRNKLLNFEELV